MKSGPRLPFPEPEETAALILIFPSCQPLARLLPISSTPERDRFPGAWPALGACPAGQSPPGDASPHLGELHRSPGRACLALEELSQSLWLSVIPVGYPSSWLYSGSFLTHQDPLAQSMRFPSLDSTPCSPFSQSVASILLESMNRPLDCCPFSLMNVRLSPS